MMDQVPSFKNIRVDLCGDKSGKKWSRTEPHCGQVRAEFQVGMLGVYNMVLDDGESIKVTFRVMWPLVFE